MHFFHSLTNFLDFVAVCPVKLIDFSSKMWLTSQSHRSRSDWLLEVTPRMSTNGVSFCFRASKSKNLFGAEKLTGLTSFWGKIADCWLGCGCLLVLDCGWPVNIPFLRSAGLLNRAYPLDLDDNGLVQNYGKLPITISTNNRAPP